MIPTYHDFSDQQCQPLWKLLVCYFQRPFKAIIDNGIAESDDNIRGPLSVRLLERIRQKFYLMPSQETTTPSLFVTDE